VDTDTGARVYLHLVTATCLPSGVVLPDPEAAPPAAPPRPRKAGAASSTAARWGGTNNDNRASVFVRWLLDTYSLPRLCSGVGVLDVAGGSGQVAWNLTCLRRCPSIVIDPRPAVTNSKQRAYLRYRIFKVRVEPDALLTRRYVAGGQQLTRRSGEEPFIAQLSRR
jgi:hypothetical protein